MDWRVVAAVLSGGLAAAAPASANPPQRGEMTYSAEMEPTKVRITSYYIAREDRYSCERSQRVPVLDKQGKVIDTVCAEFYRELLMQGTGIVSLANGRRVLVNAAGRKKGITRFEIEYGCVQGKGVQERCLIPFYSAAANLSLGHWEVGDIVYIPAAEGTRLPDGSTHPGYFRIDDTGGGLARNGRLDLFDGRHPNFWSSRFHNDEIYTVYRVTGELKERVERWLETRARRMISRR